MNGDLRGLPYATAGEGRVAGVTGTRASYSPSPSSFRR